MVHGSARGPIGPLELSKRTRKGKHANNALARFARQRLRKRTKIYFGELVDPRLQEHPSRLCGVGLSGKLKGHHGGHGK